MQWREEETPGSSGSWFGSGRSPLERERERERERDRRRGVDDFPFSAGRRRPRPRAAGHAEEERTAAAAAAAAAALKFLTWLTITVQASTGHCVGAPSIVLPARRVSHFPGAGPQWKNGRPHWKEEEEEEEEEEREREEKNWNAIDEKAAGCLLHHQFGHHWIAVGPRVGRVHYNSHHYVLFINDVTHTQLFSSWSVCVCVCVCVYWSVSSFDHFAANRRRSHCSDWVSHHFVVGFVSIPLHFTGASGFTVASFDYSSSLVSFLSFFLSFFFFLPNCACRFLSPIRQWFFFCFVCEPSVYSIRIWLDLNVTSLPPIGWIEGNEVTYKSSKIQKKTTYTQ